VRKEEGGTVSADPFEDPIKQKKYLKIALFGKGGTGKTRFALSFPKVCIVDSEKGSQPYIGRYNFQVKVANRWRQLEPILAWIRAHPGVYETLVIDSATVFYLDLIQDIIDYIKNKRGNETMTRGDWGVEKRRFAAFLGMLTELPMNVILSFREKDEYLEATNKSGEEILKKTGEFLLDADKQTEYLFDIALRCFTEENKKTKESKFLVACAKTRYDWMPKYSVHDVTKKRAFKELFEPHVGEMLDAPDAPVVEPSEPILIVPDSTDPAKEAVELATTPGAPEDSTKSTPTRGTPEENLAEIAKTFGVTKPTPDQPEATLEDIKVLMTRANEMRWPDDEHKCRRQSCSANGHIHPHFKGADAKSMIRSLYGVESSKELRKPQTEFLHEEFGKVLAGRAFLSRDGEGTVYVATPSGATEEEVRAKVLLYVK
jgi:hypothetical protein